MQGWHINRYMSNMHLTVGDGMVSAVQDVRKAEKAAKDEEQRQADLRSYKNVMTVSVAADTLNVVSRLSA